MILGCKGQVTCFHFSNFVKLSLELKGTLSRDDMRSTALSQKLSRTAYIYVSRGKDLLQIDGLEVKRRETSQKLRLVSLNHRWAATRSSADTHTATKQMAAFISLRGRSKHLACQFTPGRSLQFQFRTS